MLPTMQIGPLSIAVPGLIILVGLWIALYLSERRAVLHQISPNLIYNLVVWSMVAGIVGARLAFLARYPQAFIKNPLSLISLNPGLLDPLAGSLIGITCFVIYINRVKASWWSVLDAITPGLIFFYIALNLSQFASGSSYGLPTTMPWAIRLWESNRHPVQIYAAFTGAMLLGWIWFSYKQEASSAPGVLFLKSLLLISATHLFIAGFRESGATIGAGIRSEQIITWMILASSFWLYRKRYTTKTFV